MENVQLLGVFLQSLAHACRNLHIIAEDSVDEILATNPTEWYPAERFTSLLRSLEGRFRDFEPIKERLGAEMMRLWYEHGPGRSIVSDGVGFLRFQTGSEGYHSVVRGPPDSVGDFALEELDVARGRARVRSTTPFDRTMERGVLLGGMKLAGDLVHVDVRNDVEPSVFEIEFH